MLNSRLEMIDRWQVKVQIAQQCETVNVIVDSYVWF